MTKSRGILKARRKWKAEELALIAKLYPSTFTATLAKFFNCTLPQIYSVANKLKIDKNTWYNNSGLSGRLVKGDKRASDQYRFKKGNVPANKGIKCVPHVNSIATQFKAGQQSKNYKPVGHTRICNQQGYVLIKMAEGINQYKHLHRVIWQRLNGPVPAGHVLTFRDGNKLNTKISNIELITIKQKMLRNSVHSHGPELAQLHQLRGQITRQINKRRKEDEQRHISA